MASSKPITVFAREAFYVPRKAINEDTLDLLRKKTTYRFYDEKRCLQCPYLEDRHSDICDECPSFKSEVRLSAVRELNGKEYLKLPIGAPGLLDIIADEADRDIKIKKLYATSPIRPFKMLKPLRDYQAEALEALVKAKRGVYKAPPRSGKTVTGAAIVQKLQRKTLILASQHEWLVNFYVTFVGSDVEEPFTDISKKRIGFPKKLTDFEKYDVCLVTYQMFLSPKGKKLLKKVAKLFGVLIIDEVHFANADQFSLVVSQFQAEYKIGLSGTPPRKDGKHVIVRHLIGKVAHTSIVPRLIPRLELVQTGFSYDGKGNVNWVRFVNRLELDPKRLKLMAEWALKDRKADHLVLIPLARVSAIKALAETINKLAGKKVAWPFYGQQSKDVRNEVIVKAREYKVRIIVGNIRLLSTGINIPRASCIYERATPTSNIPTAEQRLSRILTIHEGKPQPLIRYFMDDSNICRNTARNEYFNFVYPQLRPQMPQETRDRLVKWLTTGKMSGIGSNYRRPTGGVI